MFSRRRLRALRVRLRRIYPPLRFGAFPLHGFALFNHNQETLFCSDYSGLRPIYAAQPHPQNTSAPTLPLQSPQLPCCLRVRAWLRSWQRSSPFDTADLRVLVQLGNHEVGRRRESLPCSRLAALDASRSRPKPCLLLLRVSVIMANCVPCSTISTDLTKNRPK